METATLPPRAELVAAFFAGDAAYDGVFVAAVRTTRIFCRPTCRARKPRPEHVEFFATPGAALRAGYRPCRRCRPTEPAGAPPAWLAALLRDVEAEPERRWRAADLRARGLDPGRVRRWFQRHHGMSFHAWGRARRLGLALHRIQGGASVVTAALDHGYDSLSGFNDAFRRLIGEPPRDARTRTRVVVAPIPTPLGTMLAGATDGALCLLEFADRRMLEAQLRRLQHRLACAIVPGRNDVIGRTAEELEGYFAGRLRAFGVPLTTPGTPFQQEVWRRLRAIPYGATLSYAELAREVGRPRAVRAVARANGDNRLAILIPCHRVVGADGALTGYGGGLWRKRRLLELESAHAGG